MKRLCVDVLLLFSEVVLKKKLLALGHCPKGGGGGVQTESNNFLIGFC